MAQLPPAELAIAERLPVVHRLILLQPTHQGLLRGELRKSNLTPLLEDLTEKNLYSNVLVASVVNLHLAQCRELARDALLSTLDV